MRLLVGLLFGFTTAVTAQSFWGVTEFPQLLSIGAISAVVFFLWIRKSDAGGIQYKLYFSVIALMGISLAIKNDDVRNAVQSTDSYQILKKNFDVYKERLGGDKQEQEQE